MNNWLKETRLKSGLTQKELGDKIGLTVHTIAKLETNENVGSEETWRKIHKVLKNDTIFYEIVALEKDFIVFKKANRNNPIENLRVCVSYNILNNKTLLINEKYSNEEISDYVTGTLTGCTRGKQY